MAQLPTLDVGNLSKPATVLIEKISDAIGGLAQPWQIERVAKAEARAALIRANSDIEIDDLKRRALVRLVNEEAKRQQNIENIISGSISLLAQDADPSHMDEDWIEHLFERARHVSDIDMQRYWSHLLAGEANEPRRFSKNTINILSNLTSLEAGLFKRLSATFAEIETEDRQLRAQRPMVPCILLQQVNTAYVKRFGLTYDDIVALESLSLIRLGYGASYGFSYEDEKNVVNIRYRADAITIDVSKTHSVPGGLVIFTRWGEELAALLQWENDEPYWREVKLKFFK